MGQYFITALLDINFPARLGGIEAFDGGLHTGRKLTVHSLYFNVFTETICKMLLNNPKKVYWIGDNADANDMDENVLSLARKLERQLIDVDKDFTSMRGYYLANQTKRVYIDLGVNYVKAASYNNYEYDCVCHPLPILTAVGNGYGGGDYYGMNEHLAGSWAGDEICLLDSRMNIIDFKDVTYECIFVEGYEDINRPVDDFNDMTPKDALDCIKDHIVDEVENDGLDDERLSDAIKRLQLLLTEIKK